MESSGATGLTEIEGGNVSLGGNGKKKQQPTISFRAVDKSCVRITINVSRNHRTMPGGVQSTVPRLTEREDGRQNIKRVWWDGVEASGTLSDFHPGYTAYAN